MGMIRCSTCRENKDNSFFSKNKSHKTGYSNLCKKCVNKRAAEAYKNNPHRKKLNERMRLWRKNHPDNYKDVVFPGHLKRAYGLNIDDYNKLLKDRNGRCDICKETKNGKLHLDHDHLTGKIRGFLCGSCNRGIGLFKDNSELLIKAIEYLRKT